MAACSHFHIQRLTFRDPLEAFAPFANDKMAAFLDSADSSSGQGRFSYIAADPFRVIEAGACVTVDGTAVSGDPFTVLERELEKYRLETHPDLPPFQAGAVGFLGYELGRHIERLPAPSSEGLRAPDMVIGFYDTIAVFDLVQRQAWVISTSVARGNAEARSKVMALRIENAPSLAPIDWTLKGSWNLEVTQSEYEQRVSKIIDYIYAGDVFQVNLTQRFLGKLVDGLESIHLYRRLRALSPAPFAAFLACGKNFHLLSASPERFLRLSFDGLVDTRPIKGTRPRGQTPDDDAALAASLLASEKDRAENLMIVDLLRNDLSRVCRTGSVRATDLLTLETFASVHHLVSGIQGRLMPDLGCIDLFRASFPGGSITGAPKIRAMEIINELEPARRGPYCGAIVWMGFNGASESSISIRTIVIEDDCVVAQAGGAVVSDSDPSAEYAETLVKAAPLLESLTADCAPGRHTKRTG